MSIVIGGQRRAGKRSCGQRSLRTPCFAEGVRSGCSRGLDAGLRPAGLALAWPGAGTEGQMHLAPLRRRVTEPITEQPVVVAGASRTLQSGIAAGSGSGALRAQRPVRLFEDRRGALEHPLLLR